MKGERFLEKTEKMNEREGRGSGPGVFRFIKDIEKGFGIK